MCPKLEWSLQKPKKRQKLPILHFLEVLGGGWSQPNSSLDKWENTLLHEESCWILIISILCFFFMILTPKKSEDFQW